MTTTTDSHPESAPLPAPLEVGLSLAQLLLLDDAKERAAEVLDRVLELDPDTHDALLLRGLIHEDADQLEGAFGCFQQAAAAYPDSWPAHYHLGRTLGAIGRHEEAIAELGRADALSGHDLRVLHALALVQHAAGRPGLAAEALAQAIALDPRDLDGYASLADLLLARGALAQAIELLEHARTQLPDASALLARLARCHMRTGQWREAAETLQQQLAQDPDDEGTYLGLAQAALGHADVVTAAQAADACLERFPDSWRALHLRATLYDTADRLDLAMRDLRRAVEIEPRAWQPLSDLGLFTCTRATGGSAEARHAVELLERAVELCGGDAWAPQLNLALALVKAGESERARQLAQSIVELGPPAEPAVEQAHALLGALGAG